VSTQHDSYRESHRGPGYGREYERTYQKGYYRWQWEYLERPLLERVLGDLETRGVRSVLDFACGTGRILCVLEAHFGDVSGVDISQPMLSIARERCRKSKLIQQDITITPLGRTFDLCTAFRFFLNAESSLRRDALEAIRDHLGPQGYLVANVHVNEESILGKVYQLRNRIYGRNVANVYGIDEFSRLLEATGFSIQKVFWYSYLPRTGSVVDEVARALLVPVDKMMELCGSSVKKHAQAFLVVARKKIQD